jgi:hypothetical protein
MKNKAPFRKQTVTAWEFALVKGCFRAYMNGDDIPSALFPAKLIESGWIKIMTGVQIDSLVLTLKNNQDHLGEKAFGDKQNKMIWSKFLSFLDINCHYFAILTNGNKVKIFEANNRFYQYDTYVKEPRREFFIRPEFIEKRL